MCDGACRRSRGVRSRAPINFARIDEAEIGFHRRDLKILNQNVRVQMLSNREVHGNNNGITNDRTVH